MKYLNKLWKYLTHKTINEKLEKYDKDFFEINCMLRMLLKKNGYNGDLREQINKEMVRYSKELDNE